MARAVQYGGMRGPYWLCRKSCENPPSSHWTLVPSFQSHPMGEGGRIPPSRSYSGQPWWLSIRQFWTRAYHNLNGGYFDRKQSVMENTFDGRPSSIQGHLPSKVVLNPRSSSIQGHLPSTVFSHPRSSSIKGCPPSMIILHPKSSSIQGCLPSQIVFYRRLSSIQGHLPSKVVLISNITYMKI